MNSRLSAVLDHCLAIDWVTQPPNVEQLNKALRLYGLAHEDYLRMHAEQRGLCAICAKPPSFEPGQIRRAKRGLCVDHCHATGNVRGLVCSNCNTAIGLMRDDSTTMRSAAEYIDRSKL